jgi:hypothetical protein
MQTNKNFLVILAFVILTYVTFFSIDAYASRYELDLESNHYIHDARNEALTASYQDYDSPYRNFNRSYYETESFDSYDDEARTPYGGEEYDGNDCDY